MRMLMTLCVTAAIGASAPTTATAHPTPHPIATAAPIATHAIATSMATLASAIVDELRPLLASTAPATPLTDDDGCPLPGNVATKNGCTMRAAVAETAR